MIAADLLRGRRAFVQLAAGDYFAARSDETARRVFRLWWEYDECLCAAIAAERNESAALGYAELIVDSVDELRRWREDGRLRVIADTRPDIDALAERADELLQRWERATARADRVACAFELCAFSGALKMHELVEPDVLRVFLDAAAGTPLLELLRRG